MKIAVPLILSFGFLLVHLKLEAETDWPWLLVLSPFWLLGLGVVAIVLIPLIAAAIGKAGSAAGKTIRDSHHRKGDI